MKERSAQIGEGLAQPMGLFRNFVSAYVYWYLLSAEITSSNIFSAWYIMVKRKHNSTMLPRRTL